MSAFFSGLLERGEGGVRTVGVGVLCFVLGVLVMLLLRDAPKELPPSPVDAGACPPAAPCAVCDCTPPPRTPPHPHVGARTPRREPPTPPTSEPLPTAAEEAEAHRDRLRSWFESQAPGLADCVAASAPRRKLLLEMHVEDDGRIARATLLGADELPKESAACVKRRVEALVVPREALRGRETVVVHVTL